MARLASPGLERRLRKEVAGEVMFGAFDRGRYATDASIYQMMPVGVVVPKTLNDIRAALSAARDENVPVLPRGGGTSQCGQTVNHALVIDNSKYFGGLLDLDVEGRRCTVEPGIVLDELNRILKPHGLWYPVDVSTASRATVGGMAANNSCGGRSIRYGTMRDNVIGIEAILADGNERHFGETIDTDDNLKNTLLDIGQREQAEIAHRFPNVLRRVGGYNIDALVPSNTPNNLAHLLVGSEGTLAYSTAIELKLSPLPERKVMGICHFPTFHAAMDSTQHLVTLKPQAVELVDATMIGLARDIPMFLKTVESCVRGDPAAILLVEFAEASDAANMRKLEDLDDMMGSLGFSWSGSSKRWGGVTQIIDNAQQVDLAEMRKSGLNIMMSMKEAGKPVSFVEDCAVELPDLAAYTAGLTELFQKHGTTGTWYAHASVGCLHVRPILNMKSAGDVGRMRAIGEQAFELVRKYKGSHSGEHGDGIVRSEFHEAMFGKRMVDTFRDVKTLFDPKGLFNPGKIVDAPKMDDRSLFRYPPGYLATEMDTALDWSAWPKDQTTGGGGFQGAVEMCNNNGACRKLKGGAMCPSYRVTRDEKHLTRGRANTLRLAITGQLGEAALTSDDMADTLKLCVSCKACKRECPTGVDIAAMKLEVHAARAKTHGISLHDRLVAFLPHYAPYAAKLPWAMNARNTLPGLAGAMQSVTGFSAKRDLPRWRSNIFRDSEGADTAEPRVVLFADTFNRYFEPENLRAALRVMNATGTPMAIASAGSGRPLCCGRTFLSAGLIDRAKAEAERLIAVLLPHAKAGRAIIGLEPSCLLTLRDEIPRLFPGNDAALIAEGAVMLEEHLASMADTGKMDLPLQSPAANVLLHGHCHQKSFGLMPAIERTLRLLPDTKVSTIESSCCGMAGSFGYNTETEETSRAMGELDLFPAIRARPEDTIVVADGTSCRHQIADGTKTEAVHVARLLDMALNTKKPL